MARGGGVGARRIVVEAAEQVVRARLQRAQPGMAPRIDLADVVQVFQSVFGWRTFFLIFAMEDYVEMARAKGLPNSAVERRYILRPTLPNIITRFALMLIGLWTGAILLETVFNWPGLGRLFYQAVGLYDTPVIVGNTVIYAYLLALTVFLLDFIYALVDPRVKVGS